MKKFCRILCIPLISFIRLYQRTLSLLMPSVCRFTPSCSEYAIEAIEKKGVVKGLALALWRILRCNPFSRGGYDPVEKGGSYEQRQNQTHRR